MRIKISEFLRKHPELLKGKPDMAELRRRIKALVAIDDVILTDDEKGEELEISEVILITAPVEVDEAEAAAAAAAAAAEDGEVPDEEEDEELKKTVQAAVAKALASGKPGRVPIHQPADNKLVIPAQCRRYRAKNLRQHRVSIKDPELLAYRFGLWFIATASKVPSVNADWALKRCQELGLDLTWKVMGEGVNTTGGFLVLPEFEPTMIELMEMYGVFRNWADIEPMASDTKSITRRTGGLTAYFVGESAAGTETTMAVDRVNLVARKIMSLTMTSNELSEDAIISIGDRIMTEIGYSFVYKEDICGFIGDGSQTYGGIVGAATRLTNVNGVDEGGGVIVGTGDTPAELTLADFNKTIGILPQYADTPNCAWYTHRTVWATSMQRLEAAAGGNTITDIENGARAPKFLGYPVRMSQVMAIGSAVSQVLAIFGDLKLAATFGDRRGMTIATSDSALNAFEQDELAVRGTERFDINVHDVGTATVAGPIVALVGKAS